MESTIWMPQKRIRMCRKRCMDFIFIFLLSNEIDFFLMFFVIFYLLSRF
ncbi:hypothetical protein CIPAW_03G177500 [Carya illinoinensis]|uniref:Transmembrane protein n=1 Tax=Carya illinoinensis TaxID=32201 RepID=A0A8T1R529_CARIL|nr:hypothetical protein CIPAW_03G177500 [Carya illinoinensis]